MSLKDRAVVQQQLGDSNIRQDSQSLLLNRYSQMGNKNPLGKHPMVLIGEIRCMKCHSYKKLEIQIRQGSKILECRNLHPDSQQVLRYLTRSSSSSRLSTNQRAEKVRRLHSNNREGMEHTG
jgi:hypothetical protein